MKHFHKIKKMKDGRAMLNLGCGPRTHWEWNNMDFSPYAHMAHHRRFARFLHIFGILSSFRYENVLKVDPDIIHWDIRKGIPFEDNAFDVVYHSHFITHLDCDAAAYVTHECYRVLKAGRTVRVVVPDLSQIVYLYNEAIDGMEKGNSEATYKHKKAVDDLFELMVRKEPVGPGRQNFFVRAIERLVRGDINSMGELRRWHYDQYSMGTMLRDARFRDLRVIEPTKSRIEGWNEFGLDLNEDGSVYKSVSLYMEGIK